MGRKATRPKANECDLAAQFPAPSGSVTALELGDRPERLRGDPRVERAPSELRPRAVLSNDLDARGFGERRRLRKDDAVEVARARGWADDDRLVKVEPIIS